MNYPEGFSAAAYEASRSPLPATPYDDDRALAEIIRTNLIDAVTKAQAAIAMMDERHNRDVEGVRDAIDDAMNDLIGVIEKKIADWHECRADDAAWGDTTRKGAYLMSGV